MKIALRAVINSRYLSAEYGGGVSPPDIAMTANRYEFGGYETFDEQRLQNGWFALKTNSSNYLTADIDGTLRTNSTEVGAWENFRWNDSFIETIHGTRLTARIDKPSVPLETTPNQGTWEQFIRESLESELPNPEPDPDKRTGVIHASGRAAEDDQGMFHPWGVTFFWALYGWKYERDRIQEHLAWLNNYQPDYLRILGEVNWQGRSIEPFGWPDYQNILAEYVDYAYDTYGIRSEMTMVGGKYRHEHEKLVAEVVQGRESKFAHIEVANEYSRLDKISVDDMVRAGRYFRDHTPNLVSLSRADTTLGYKSMIDLTRKAGCNMYTPHFRRSDHDVYWSAVRQGYDSKEFPDITSNNEGQGPQSSVEVLNDPMQCAMYRATTIVCSGSFFVLHVGQGVTGIADPNHGRPQNMWEVPNIDRTMELVSGIGKLIPAGVENWQVVNNGRSSHPMPLDPRIGYGFWEGNTKGSVNKNYACINGNRFCEVLLGVNNTAAEGNTVVGKPIRNMNINVINGSDLSEDSTVGTTGNDVLLAGRSDKMKGYVLIGS